jgi:hypothetical protein
LPEAAHVPLCKQATGQIKLTAPKRRILLHVELNHRNDLGDHVLRLYNGSGERWIVDHLSGSNTVYRADFDPAIDVA